jgi:cell wall-associated NlpC family hydrolase
VRLEPAASHAALLSGQALRFSAAPVLYLEFEGIETEVECRAAGTSFRFPLAFAAPRGQRLLGVRTGTQDRSHSHDHYCTNRPYSCSGLPGPSGNGPSDYSEEESERLRSEALERVRARLAARANAGAVATAASKYSGKPYRLGSKGPDSFDCSGLMSQALKDAGFPDPVATGTGGGCNRAWNNSDAVAENDVQVDDIIFFDYEGDGVPDHCGIVSGVESGHASTYWHASGKGVNEGNPGQNAKQEGGVWQTYGHYRMGYRRPRGAPTPGECAAPGPCGGE